MTRALFLALVAILAGVVVWVMNGLESSSRATEVVRLDTGATSAVELPDAPEVTPDVARSPVLGAPEEAAEVRPLRLAPHPSRGRPTRRVAGRFVRASTGEPLRETLPFSFLQGSVDLKLLYSAEESGVFDVEAPVGTDGLALRPGALGFGGIQHLSELFSPEEDVKGLVVEVDTGWATVVEVRDTGGLPIAGARVGVQETRPRATDAKGRVTLVDLTRGGTNKAWVIARHPHYAPTLELVTVPDGPHLVGPIRVELALGGAVEGTVRDTYGAPLENVMLLLVGRPTGYFDDLRSVGVRTRSDEAGHFRLEGLPAGPVLLEALGKELPGHWLPAVEVDMGHTTWVDVVLHPGVAVAGSVVDEEGLPVEGVHVMLHRSARWTHGVDEARGTTLVDAPEGWRRPSSLVTGRAGGPARERLDAVAKERTDAEGRFLSTVLRPGPVKVVLEVFPGRFIRPLPLELVIPEEGAPVEARFVLEEGSHLVGRVSDAEGNPVASARVRASSSGGRHDVVVHGSTDRQGRFELEGLLDNTLTLRVEHADFATWEGEVAPGGADGPVVVLDPVHHLWLRVVDDVSGEPLDHFMVVVNSEEESILFRAVALAGLYEARVSADDNRGVVIKTDGYRSRALANVLATLTSAERPLEVRLVPDG